MKIIIMIIFLHLMVDVARNMKNKSLIYILTWSESYLTPALDDEQGLLYFINRNCSFQNCFVTSNVSYFSDVSNFDVILFNSMTLDYNLTLPSVRTEEQKYVFMSDESPAMYPTPRRYNGFFNLTWTYKLDSDATWKFFVIRNKEGEVIAPKRSKVKWIDLKYMKPIHDDVKRKLQNKNKAAAWFVSHCETPSKREEVVKKLNEELGKYNLHVDIYGRCGNNVQCNRLQGDKCYSQIEPDYYFYLALENSMCEDYITEKILIATKHYSVPIVYGGADYKRFLPPGSYLDADTLGHGTLASIMNDTIVNKAKYYDFFKWHNNFSIHATNETADTDEICAFCAFLNNKKHSYSRSVYTRFDLFWFYYNAQPLHLGRPKTR